METTRFTGSRRRAARARRPRRAREDEALVEALRAGDEPTFSRLVGQWSGMMLRVARAHVRNRAVAEEVVQEAWLTVIRSLDRFAFRAAFRTWVLGIVVNLSRAQARAERRLLARSDAPPVDPARFLPEDHPRWPGHWAVAPTPWPSPEEELVAGETRRSILRAIDTLPPAQREVLTLRDLEGLDASEVCEVLGITDGNQRVLLHRARSRVRAAIERSFASRRPAR